MNIFRPLRMCFFSKVMRLGGAIGYYILITCRLDESTKGRLLKRYLVLHLQFCPLNLMMNRDRPAKQEIKYPNTYSPSKASSSQFSGGLLDCSQLKGGLFSIIAHVPYYLRQPPQRDGRLSFAATAVPAALAKHLVSGQREIFKMTNDRKLRAGLEVTVRGHLQPTLTCQTPIYPSPLEIGRNSLQIVSGISYVSQRRFVSDQAGQ